jgi:hypothetical protein
LAERIVLRNKAILFVPVTCVAIAHAWFELIHPFDDGNGRVGRALADHALSQSLGYPTLACLATAIERNRQRYYAALQQISRGVLDLNAWIAYFINEINQAQEIAREEIDFVLGKARFWERYAVQLNERQSRMVRRVFAEGTQGFEGGSARENTKRFANAPGRRLIVICRRWSRWACSNPCPAVVAIRVTSCGNPDPVSRTDPGRWCALAARPCQPLRSVPSSGSQV